MNHLKFSGLKRLIILLLALTQGPSCGYRQMPVGARVTWRVSSLTWQVADAGGQLGPSGNYGPEHLHVAPPCGLDFLAAWRLDSKSESPPKTGWKCMAFF